DLLRHEPDARGGGDAARSRRLDLPAATRPHEGRKAEPRTFSFCNKPRPPDDSGGRVGHVVAASVRLCPAPAGGWVGPLLGSRLSPDPAERGWTGRRLSQSICPGRRTGRERWRRLPPSWLRASSRLSSLKPPG